MSPVSHVLDVTPEEQSQTFGLLVASEGFRQGEVILCAASAEGLGGGH
jgi:hypothetical protein